MASYTITSADVFPNGTTVGAYLARGVVSNGTGPLSSPVASGTMTNGSVTFTGLTEDERYVAAAQVGGVWRYVAFEVDEVPHDPIYTDDDYTQYGDVEFTGAVDLSAATVTAPASIAVLADNETITGTWTFSTKAKIAEGAKLAIGDGVRDGASANLYPAPTTAGIGTEGIEIDGSISLRKDTSATDPPVIAWNGANGRWVTGFDIGATVAGRDFVLATKLDHPSAGNTRDVVYVAHNGTDPPTVGIGAQAPTLDATTKLLLWPDDSEKPAQNTLRIVRGGSQTGDPFQITTTSATKQFWVDSDYQVTVRASGIPLHVKSNGDATMLKVSVTDNAVKIPTANGISIGSGAPDLPLAQVDVATTGSTDASLRLRTASNGNLEIRGLAASAINRIRTMNASSLELGTNSTTRIEISSGGNLGFFGATPVARQTLGAAATDLASVITLANNLRTAQINLGLGQT